MKKYTIVWRESYIVGSHQQVLFRADRVETDDIALVVKQMDGAAVYCFEGWPRQEGEEGEPKAGPI